MDSAFAVNAGVGVLIVPVAAYLRAWLSLWITPATLTRLMPLIVVLLAVAGTLLARLLPVDQHAVIQSVVEAAAAAMAAYSGTKAVAGAS